MGYLSITIAMLLTSTASQPVWVNSSSPECTDVLDDFLKSKNLHQVSRKKVDIFLEIERTKDVLGCQDVACYSEVLGALDIRLAVDVKAEKYSPLCRIQLYDLWSTKKGNNVFFFNKTAKNPKSLSGWRRKMLETCKRKGDEVCLNITFPEYKGIYW